MGGVRDQRHAQRSLQFVAAGCWTTELAVSERFGVTISKCHRCSLPLVAADQSVFDCGGVHDDSGVIRGRCGLTDVYGHLSLVDCTIGHHSC